MRTLSAAPAAPGAQRGAALLTAMVIVTLVATLAAGMVWQQWRAVQVEAAERARAQAYWILDGAIDWARLILREDSRENARDPEKAVDHLGEPWAVPLAEAKLSTFLALDAENTDAAPEAFLSGRIVDATSRYNLRRLTGGDSEQEQRVLQRLLQTIGARAELAPLLARALTDAAPPTRGASAPQPSADPPLMPERLDQLVWLGIDAETIAAIAPYVTLLPDNTPVNVNTAPKEVLAAVIEGLDLASAERLVQMRQRNPFSNPEALRDALPQGVQASGNSIGFRSVFFEVHGRLRLGERVVEQRALVRRVGLNIEAVRRERVAALDAAGTP